jgi:hypothetical protein
MSHRVRRARQTLLLSAWIIGYHILIQSFAVLQRVEKLLKGATRNGQAGTNKL